MKIYTQDWFTRNIPIWKEVLKEFIGKDDLNFLEIGVFEGRASNWLLENILTRSGCYLFALDTFKGSMESEAHDANTVNLLERYQNNIEENRDKVKIVIGESQKLLREWDQVIFDCIYIDGSHKANDVIQDIVLSWYFLKSGGILIMDDYDWRFYDDPKLLPYPAIDAFLSLYEGQYQLIEKHMQVIVRKI